MKVILISEAQSRALLGLIHKKGLPYDFVAKKNELHFYREQAIDIKFRLPISIQSPQEFTHNPENNNKYILIIIQSGMAAVGYFERGIPLDHKVFRAYMVRKKQGKSQLKYLKTKGKSRAGSRVRLAKSLEFFEEINLRLNEYFTAFQVDRIGLSCSPTLIPYFFGSKTAPPFKKNDPRILNIPKHIQNPTYEALLHTNQFLRNGEIRYTDENHALTEMFFEELKLDRCGPGEKRSK